LNKAIIPSPVGETFSIHGFGEPFATIEADLYGEGQPALNAGVHETEQGVNEIMIEGQAFPESGDKLQFFDIAVAMDIKTGARFDTCQDSDEAGGYSIPLSNPTGDGFLIGVTGRQILDRSLQILSRTQRSFLHFCGELLNVGAEIFQENLISSEKSVKSFDVGNRTQGASKNQPVESAQDPSDMFRMICYKMVHGALRLKRNGFANNFYFIGGTVSIFKPLFGCGFAAL